MQIVPAISALLVFTACVDRLANADEGAPDDDPAARVERLLEAVASGGDLEPSAAELIPQLIELVEEGNPQESTLAIRALAAIGPDAAPAATALCERLGDPAHSIRAFAVQALVAIGPASIEPLRTELDSPTGRARAAAVASLHQLEALTLDEVTSLIGDVDPRVRGAVAVALSRAGEPGVPALTQLLNDSEVAVAVKAADALKINRSAPSIAIPALIDVLPRRHVGASAANALASYGIEARRAVPVLIANYPLESAEYQAPVDLVEVALSRIGPPHDQDVATVCECLNKRDARARILAARSLALMGESGREAADALEAATFLELDRYLAAQNEWDLDPFRAKQHPDEILTAAESMIGAVWYVTRDGDRFLRHVEASINQIKQPLWFYEWSPWSDFNPADWSLMESMLRRRDLNLKTTLLSGVIEIGPRAAPVGEVIYNNWHSSFRLGKRLDVEALVAIGPETTIGAGRLYSMVYYRELSLSDYADAVRLLQIKSEESRLMLESGLQSTGDRIAFDCAQALSATTDDPLRTAGLVIDCASDGRLLPHQAVELLRTLQAGHPDELTYLMRVTAVDPPWDDAAAVAAIGDLGLDSSESLVFLNEQLADIRFAVRMSAAKSLLQLTGDSAPLEWELQLAFSNDDASDRLHAVRIIGELEGKGEPYLAYVLLEAERSAESFTDDEWRYGIDNRKATIDALQAIGTTAAIAELEKVASSNDWAMRSLATAALDELKNLEPAEAE